MFLALIAARSGLLRAEYMHSAVVMYYEDIVRMVLVKATTGKRSLKLRLKREHRLQRTQPLCDRGEDMLMSMVKFAHQTDDFFLVNIHRSIVC